MSKDNYDFNDLDAILAEFRDEGTAEKPPVPEAEPVTPAPETEPAVEVYSSHAADSPFSAPGSDDTVRYELPPIYSREEEKERKAAQKSRFRKAKPEPEPETAAVTEASGESGEEAPKKKRRRGRKAKTESGEEKPKKAPKEARTYAKKRIPWILRALMTLVFLAAALIVLAWTLVYLHPASGTLNSFSAADTRLRLSGKLDEYVNNAAADALGDLTYIKKVYTLQESDTVAPAPDPKCYGSTYDPNEVLEVIKNASVLLDGQDVTFYAGANFAADEPIRWYCDDTILVIAWKEYIEGRYCNLAEVKIAHGSQLRRKLADDTFGSGVQYYASELARSSNAVVASNADFYGFRDIGLTVYQRNLYRFNPDRLDICFFTSSGDMLFTRAGELTSPEQTEQYIQDNDVVFSLAFGPILVDDGELQYCSGYPIGEVNTEYTRSCIAMTDDLHYLLMTVSWSPDGLSPHATVNDLSRTIYSKNVKKAYALDGGQTAEIVMMGEPFSRIDWNAERVVSDIIYFATAIPEEVRP